MRTLYFGAALVSLLASAPALAQAGPSLSSLPNPNQVLNFGSGAGGVNSASTAQAQGAGLGASATTGTGGTSYR